MNRNTWKIYYILQIKIDFRVYGISDQYGYAELFDSICAQIQKKRFQSVKH